MEYYLALKRNEILSFCHSVNQPTEHPSAELNKPDTERNIAKSHMWNLNKCFKSNIQREQNSGYSGVVSEGNGEM